VFLKLEMVELIAIEAKPGTTAHLRFSDGAHGTYDFSHFLAADTVMTSALPDAAFFQSCFIEAGALAWPSGFDLSAVSLQRALADSGQLARDSAAV
jgi:hypothetical protein